jgi:hypothetical protein
MDALRRQRFRGRRPAPNLAPAYPAIPHPSWSEPCGQGYPPNAAQPRLTQGGRSSGAPRRGLTALLSGAARDVTAPAPWDTRRCPHAEDNTSVRRHALLLDVTQAAGEVSRLIHEARDLNLPVEPGVREGCNALVRWAVLSETSFPSQPPTGNRQPPRPRHARAVALVMGRMCSRPVSIPVSDGALSRPRGTRATSPTASGPSGIPRPETPRLRASMQPCRPTG